VKGSAQFIRLGVNEGEHEEFEDEFGSEREAQDDAKQKVAERLARGFVELGASTAPAREVTVEPGFRRFEFVEGSSSKFWEVKVEGEQQIVRFGKIGTAGQTKEKDFDSAFEAKADTRKLIAEKTGKGYVEVGGKPKGEGNPELEAAIENDLDNPAPYLVYADWLQSKGDPLGELIVLQAGGKTKEADALIKKHAEALLGPLTKFEADTKEPGSDEQSRWNISRGYFVEWQFGFIKRLVWRWDAFNFDSEDGPGEDMEALLALPTARFIQSLRLGPCPGEEEMNPYPIVEAMEAAKGPATLRELFLTERAEWDISGTVSGDFGSIHQNFPKLRKLTLHGGQIELGKNLSLPELEELTIETGGLTKENIKELVSLKAPKLERLSVWFGDENYGASGGLKDFQPVIDARVFPKLKHLGVMNCSWVGDAVRALANSKLLMQLTSLDLSMGCLSDKDVEYMHNNRALFGHLTYLNVEDSALTPASKPKVAELAKEANFGKEQEPERAGDDAYRYVSVGE
jgi:uncharacterized protein (TIGR02996 family)